MVEVRFGQVVQSISGRDRHRIFIVIGTEETLSGTVAIIANGELRPLEKAKRKNPLHIKITAELTQEEISDLRSDLCNEKLAKLCQKYDVFSKKVEM